MAVPAAAAGNSGQIPARPTPPDLAAPPSAIPTALDAVRQMLIVTLERLAGVEANALRRLAGKPDRFLAAASDFLDKHRYTLSVSLAPGQDFWSRLGISETAEAIASRWIERSQADVLELTGQVRPAELAAGLDRLIATWSVRPEAATAFLRK
jgi:hypothetical protein